MIAPVTIEPSLDHFLVFNSDGHQIARIYSEETAQQFANALNSHEALMRLALAVVGGNTDQHALEVMAQDAIAKAVQP